MNNETFGILMTVISLCLAIAGFFVGRLTSARERGEKHGALASDIGYIKAGIDDLKLENRTIKADLMDINVRLSKNEESTKNAHQRINEILKKE